MKRLAPLKSIVIKKKQSPPKVEVYENFSVDTKIQMNTFYTLLKLCVNDKKNKIKDNSKLFNTRYFELNAKDKKTGKTDNIINLLKKKYQDIKIKSEDMFSEWNQTILEYKEVYICIIEINEKYIYLGCNLTQSKLEKAVNKYWDLYVPSRSSSSSQRRIPIANTRLLTPIQRVPVTTVQARKASTPLTSSSKNEELIIDQQLFNKQIFENFYDKTSLNAFYNEVKTCLKLKSNTDKKYYDGDFFDLTTKDKKTFSAYNIIKILNKNYKDIKLIFLEIATNEYFIRFHYKHIYIGVQGYKNKIVFFCHPVKRLLIANEEQAYEILHESSS